jgi:glycosyltransferase involved in cell wall biosynthesis
VDVFRPYYSGPIWRCPLGVDTQLYRPAERRWRRGEVFSWLHVGAPNARKGADVIEAAWARHFSQRQDMELYLKSSRGDVEYQVLAAAMREVGWSEVAEDLWTHGNVTLDMRRLSGHDLAALYATADGFLFPTAGEGWGLTIHEALATALPTVCTRYGGHLEFTSADTVQYVDGTLCAAELATDVNDGSETLEGALVQPDTLAAAMVAVMEHYPEHRQRARRAAQHVRQLTWAHAGQRLVRILVGCTESLGRVAA